MSAEPTPPTELPWWFFPALALDDCEARSVLSKGSGENFIIRGGHRP
jgi:hypothetical protein